MQPSYSASFLYAAKGGQSSNLRLISLKISAARVASAMRPSSQSKHGFLRTCADASALSKLNPWELWKSKKIKSKLARSQLYRRRFLQVNTHFAAFFEIYKILRTFAPLHPEILQIFAVLCTFFRKFLDFAKFCWICFKFCHFSARFSQNFAGIPWNCSKLHQNAQQN